MKNEYGETLDRNGYAASILANIGQCAYCGRMDRPLQRHEAFHGAFRTKSKALGCWLLICDVCHDELHHKNAEIDREIKEYMQRKAMKHYNWSVDDFRQRFGKNYLEEDDE